MEICVLKTIEDAMKCLLNKIDMDRNTCLKKWVALLVPFFMLVGGCI